MGWVKIFCKNHEDRRIFWGFNSLLKTNRRVFGELSVNGWILEHWRPIERSLDLIGLEIEGG
jgi:hypothetical protein